MGEGSDDEGRELAFKTRGDGGSGFSSPSCAIKDTGLLTQSFCSSLENSFFRACSLFLKLRYS